jgi:DNA helicase-2/ATP-dependent DNA helicase PcrA
MAEKYVLKRDSAPVNFKVDYAKDLNAEQFAVIENGDGPVLVLAGAGSGKTRTIVYRVAYLLERGVRPDNILLVTFTNKAAKEMLFRIQELLGAFPKGLWGGTFHHVANLLLRRFGQSIGFPPNFTILDEEDAKSLLSVCVKDEGIDTKAKRFPAPAVLKSIISLSQNTREPIEDIVERQYTNFLPLVESIRTVQKRYIDRKAKHHLMDFDDLLVQLDRLLRERPDVRQRISGQFKYVLVDEYQDTNKIQASLVEQLASAHGNLLVVGDDAQSIYAFRGATVRNILDFPNIFRGTKTFKLETNYRSIEPVLDVANAVIEHNTEQFQKTLKPVRAGRAKPIVVPASSTEQEAEFISQRILEFRDDGVPLSQIAVLFRATYQSQSLEFELTRRDVPYEYRGGLRFFERAHIKDLIAYLRLLDNPRDEVAFIRVAQLYEGIGIETALKLWRECFSNASPEDGLASVDCSNVAGQRAKIGIASFQKTLKELGNPNEVLPSDLISQLAKSEYREYLRVTYPNADERIEDLNELARFAERYKKLSIFLSEVSLQESFGVQGEGASDRENESCILSTIHQAKGLEWEVVFLLGCNDGAFPNPRALTEEGGIEEERRLFYVAITRAKTHLFLTYSIGVNMRLTTMRMQRPSPFIAEIPGKLIEELQLSEEPLTDPDMIIERDENGEPMSLLDTLLASHERRKKRGKR